MAKIAVVGQGVIGCSSALAILERFPKFHVSLFADRKFEDTCSFVPAGLFRLDKYEYKNWARISFDRFAHIYRDIGCSSGVKLVSGHIQSDNKATLEGQEKNFADIVYNFRWLDKREMESMFVNPSRYAIHYTAYASEGRRYVPWLREQIEKFPNVEFVQKKVNNLNELGEHFDFVINCAGIDGGKVAGDDNTVIPNRGIAIEVEAPWQTHFNYKDFITFTIPMTNSVILGSVKQPGRSDLEITDVDREDIWQRYLAIHPTFKDAKVLNEFCTVRPERPDIRLETEARKTDSGKKYQVIHNYGHGGNGFTLGWGCALEVLAHIDGKVDSTFNQSKI